MTTYRGNIGPAERGVLESLERVYGNLRDHGTAGRTFVVRQPELSARKIREGLGMSQNQFARSFGISIKTIRNWEQGVSVPEGAARAYLTVIKHDAAAVLRALEKEGPQVVELHAEASS